MSLPLPLPSLMTLVGPAGAGKSTIARAVPASWRVELDALREMVSDDPGDQLATADAVALYDQLLRARLRRRRPTLVDSTNTAPAHRVELIALAHAHGVLAVAIRVTAPLHRCIARQARRPLSQQVPGRVVAQQHAATPGLTQLREEGLRPRGRRLRDRFPRPAPGASHRGGPEHFTRRAGRLRP
ncbi:AAA family ATPase [Streptomyces albidoflavus]